VKSADSDRIIGADAATIAVGRAWQATQRDEQRLWGDAWTDSGRVFTATNNQPVKPAYVSQRFDLLLQRYATLRRRYADGWSVERIARRHRSSVDLVRVVLAGPALPPIRFHDLRHGAATMVHAAGVSIKGVSEILGHASESFTADVYAVVADELADDTAVKIAAFVPCRPRA
jgi:integrase